MAFASTSRTATCFLARRLGGGASRLRPVQRLGKPVTIRSLASLSAGDALSQLAVEHPHMDAIRYDHKNVKWSFRHVDYYAEALAIGFLQTGLAPGDVVLSWLPSRFAEQHILQFACSKSGMILYTLDPSQATTDPDGAMASLGQALEVTQANVLVTQEAGDDVNYVHLTKGVIPEIRIFDFADGMPFFTPRFPHLRFPIHTGFDNEEKHGMIPLKHMLVPNPGALSTLLGDDDKVPSGATPLLGELVVSGGKVSKGKTLTNEEVIKANAWPEFSKILTKEYLEVEGVGVVF